MTTIAAEPLGRPALPDSAADAVYRKVAVRLIPLLFLCYIAAYLDRVNVSFAKLQMQQALGLSESVYGLGSGIFFIGYFIFEIPSNVMLHKVGAGRWIARIMVTWAILSAAMMFVSSATSFYIVRFLLGVLAWFWLEDRVKNAQWLTLEERDLIARDIAAEESHKEDGSLGRVLSDGKVWLCAFIYFAIVSGLYGVTFWLPTIIKELGIPDPLQVGLIGAVPWAFGIAAMYLMARSADRRHEYRWHTAVSCVASAAGLVISVAFHADALLAMTGLTIAAMGIMSALPIFWSNPTALLGGTAAAMGIAFINSVGNLAGFAIPLLIGVIKDRTHSTDTGLHMLAVMMILGAIAVLTLRKPAAR